MPSLAARCGCCAQHHDTVPIWKWVFAGVVLAALIVCIVAELRR